MAATVLTSPDFRRQLPLHDARQHRARSARRHAVRRLRLAATCCRSPARRRSCGMGPRLRPSPARSGCCDSASAHGVFIENAVPLRWSHRNSPRNSRAPARGAADLAPARTNPHISAQREARTAYSGRSLPNKPEHNARGDCRSRTLRPREHARSTRRAHAARHHGHLVAVDRRVRSHPDPRHGSGGGHAAEVWTAPERAVRRPPLLVILLSVAAPAIIQWAVLRRVVPGLPLGFWLLFCWPFAVLAYVAVTWLGLSSMKPEAAFDLARYRQGRRAERSCGRGSG